VRRILASMFVTLVGMLAAQAAVAADLLTKASLTPAAAYNWTGWYVGGNIGYGWSTLPDPNLSYVDPGALVGFGNYFAAGGDVSPNLKPRGVIGGGQIGFNWTLTAHWVAGLIADFQGSGVRAAATNTITPPASVTTDQSNGEHMDWFGTVRAKVGFAQNNWLFYGSAGWAYGNVTTSGSFVASAVPLNFSGSSSVTKVGWAAGTGLDYSLTSKWIIGVEYLYVDLGTVSYTETDSIDAPGTSVTINNRAVAQFVRASLNYKF
jgi:outer membrane immunogenic protein